MRTEFQIAAACLAAVFASAGAAVAEPLCRQPVEAASGVQKALTSAYDNVTPGQIKRSYDRAFAAGRRQAIAAWKAKVAARCPSNSGLWLRASGKSVEACDQAMGGRFSVCVRATPGTAIFRPR